MDPVNHVKGVALMSDVNPLLLGGHHLGAINIWNRLFPWWMANDRESNRQKLTVDGEVAGQDGCEPE